MTDINEEFESYLDSLKKPDQQPQAGQPAYDPNIEFNAYQDSLPRPAAPVRPAVQPQMSWNPLTWLTGSNRVEQPAYANNAVGSETGNNAVNTSKANAPTVGQPIPSLAERAITPPPSESYPQFSPWTSWGNGIGYAVTSTPAEKVDILRAQNPGATFTKDKYGNDLVTLDGQTSYVDKPGVHWSQAPAALTDALIGMPMAIGGPLLSAAIGAGGSLAKNAVATALGSQQGVDLPGAIVSGAVGAATPVVANAIGSQIAKGTASLKGLLENGSLTTAGEDLIRRAGFDPANFTPPELQTIMSSASLVPGKAQQAATRQAIGGILSSDVPMTAGQVTGNARQLARESAYRGNGGALDFADFDKKQQVALINRANSDQVTPAVNYPAAANNPAGAIPNNSEAIGSAMNDRLSTLRGDAAAATDAAYAKIPPSVTDTVGALPDDLKNRVASLNADYKITPQAMPTASAIMADIGKMKTDKPLSLTDIIQLRKQIQNGISGGKSFTAEDKVLMALRDHVNGFMHDTTAGGNLLHLDNGSYAGVAGNSPVMSDLANANAAAKNEFNQFAPTGNRAAKAMIALNGQDSVEGNQFANKVFGSGDLNGANGSFQAVSHIMDNIGDPAMTAMTQKAAVNRVFNGLTADSTPDAISAKIDNALNGKGASIMTKLFPPAADGTPDPAIAGLARLKDQIDAIGPRTVGDRQKESTKLLKQAGIDLAGGLLGGVAAHMGLPEAMHGIEGVAGGAVFGTKAFDYGSKFLSARGQERSIRNALSGAQLPVTPRLGPLGQVALTGGGNAIMQYPAQNNAVTQWGRGLLN